MTKNSPSAAPIRITATAAALALAFAAAPRVAAQNTAPTTYKDTKYGFQVTVPVDFTQVPLDPSENWIVAKFIYKRPLEGKKDWASMAPEIRVIVFPDEALKRRATKIEKKDDDTTEILLQLNNPYKSYLDYLDREYQQGGWFVAKEQKGKIDGLDVTQRTIEVKKLASNGERTIQAWEYRLPDAAYVIQAEVLTDWNEKFKADFGKMLGGFKRVTRDTPSLSASTTGSKIAVRWWDPDQTPEQRMKTRSEYQEQLMTKALERLTEGWKQKRTDKFLFLWHCKDKFAETAMKQAAAVRKFMDERFGKIGVDFVIPCIIRMCASPEEAQSYETSSSVSFSPNNREIVLYEDKDEGSKGSGFLHLNGGIARAFMHDKNEKLWWSLPPWLEDGLSLYIARLQIEPSGKLVSRPDEWDMDVIRDKLRKGEFKPAKDLLTASEDAYSKTADRVQALAICCYLMEAGQQNKRFASVILDYMNVMDARIKEIEKTESKSRPTSSSDDDDDKWESAWRSKRKELLEHCMKTVFGKWTEGDWKTFDEAWRKSLR